MKITIRYLRGLSLLAAGALLALPVVRAQNTPAASAASSPSTTAAAPTTNAPAVATAAVTPFAPKAAASVTLKDAFKDRFLIGVALNPGQFTESNAQGAALVAREFNSITAENAMKWDALEPQNGQFRWEQADRFVEFGQKHNMFIIGHTLCWHSQLPAWVSQPEPGQTELTKEVLMERLRRHIFTVVGRYKGKVKGWDVVNEAINDGAGTYRETIFYRVIGKEYLVHAFKWAHEADPDAELYYNDYNIDANDNKRATALELVKYLRDNGAPIHGVGLQGHYNFNSPTAAKIDETIGMFTALGLKVHITELDVRARASNAALTAAVGAGGPPAAGQPTLPPGGQTAPGAQGQPAGAPAPGGPGGPGGRGGAAAITPGRPLPAIDALKTALTLTDAQVAAITPLLAADAAAITAAGGDQAKLTEGRTTTVAAIRRVLEESQQGRFTVLLTPPGGRGGRGPAAPVVPLTPAEHEAFAKRYHEIFQVFLKHKDLVRVTFWGLRDNDSWRRQDLPLLFNEDYSRKPAYDGVIHALTTAK